MPTDTGRTRKGLEGLLLECLHKHGVLECGSLKARVVKGVAYLNGFVSNRQQKKLAGEVCSRLEGIRDVVNMLRVVPLPFVDDHSLEAQVRQTLAGLLRVDVGKIAVQVVGGAVRIGGCVANMREKRLVEDRVWAISGVRHVVNNLVVLSAAEVSEAQVASEILESLSSCLGLDVSKVKVTFGDGIARLQGSVGNPRLRMAAEDVARWTPLVKGVTNELRCPATRRVEETGGVVKANAVGRPASGRATGTKPMAAP